MHGAPGEGVRAPERFGRRRAVAQCRELARQHLLHAVQRCLASAKLAQHESRRDRIPVDTRLRRRGRERDEVF